MPPLDPLIDFRDDGGTPMWRARHGQVIDVGRPQRRRKLTLAEAVSLALFAGAALPFIILFGGLAIGAALTHLF